MIRAGDTRDRTPELRTDKAAILAENPEIRSVGQFIENCPAQVTKRHTRKFTIRTTEEPETSRN